MIEAVFISDLHLHPQLPEIQARFDAFIQWASQSVQRVYILGDFFHAWAGDDAIDEWSLGIAKQLQALKSQGIKVYYMHGNRDFLLGSAFAKAVGWEMLTEPTLIQLGPERILLAHGDRYCTKDRSHQRFRKLTRNKLFPALFLMLPLDWRKRLVDEVRSQSAKNQTKTRQDMDVVPESFLSEMQAQQTRVLIHGHTHRYGQTTYNVGGEEKRRYVLSDWDDIPELLCYDNTRGLYFTRI